MTIEKSLPNMVMVCVDGVENGDIYGRYFHRYKKEETFFPDSATLVIEMERFYDAIGYPQAATKTRKFMERKGGRIPAKEHMAVISDGQALIQLRGNLATFLVGVTSRQNASWQGDVVWMEQKIRMLLEREHIEAEQISIDSWEKLVLPLLTSGGITAKDCS